MARKKKTVEEKALAKEIKAMEVAQKEEKAEKAPAKPKEEMMSFDQYWMWLSRKIKIRASYKAVIKADFAARGVGEMATKEAYDKALELYGIKL